MTPLEARKSAQQWLAGIAIKCSRGATKHTQQSDKLNDKCVTLIECSCLPGDMPIRVRCFPNVLNLKA